MSCIDSVRFSLQSLNKKGLVMHHPSLGCLPIIRLHYCALDKISQVFPLHLFLHIVSNRKLDGAKRSRSKAICLHKGPQSVTGQVECDAAFYFVSIGQVAEASKADKQCCYGHHGNVDNPHGIFWFLHFIL